MPSRLTRYILAEVMKIFVVALVVLTTLILLIGVGRTLLKEGLGPLAVGQLLPYLLPVSLQHAFPATALFSVSCVYGRMAGDGEVSTVKASGISPLKILQPALIFAFLLSPVALVLSDLAVSWGRPGIHRVVMLSIEDIVYRKMESQRSYIGKGFSIYVRDVEGRVMKSPRITISQGGTPMKFKAEEGRLRLDVENESLYLELTNSSLNRGSEIQGYIPKKESYPIPLADGWKTPTADQLRPSEMPLRLIATERLRQDQRLRAAEEKLAAHTAFSLLTSRPEEIVAESGRQMVAEINRSHRILVKLQVEPWRRWSEGFSCFFFVLIGAPLAMIAKTSEYWMTFAKAFLPTILIYYSLFILGLDMAKQSVFPPYGVWIGNAVLGVIGIGLVNHIRRC